MGHISKYHTNLVSNVPWYSPYTIIPPYQIWIVFVEYHTNLVPRIFIFNTKNSCSFLPLVLILNHLFVCILKYLKYLQKICQLFHRVFFFATSQQPCFSFDVHFFVRWCVVSFSMIMCYSCYNKNFNIVQVPKLCTLNCQGDLCYMFLILSIHVTYYSIGIYKERVELYNNHSLYHLVLVLLLCISLDVVVVIALMCMEWNFYCWECLGLKVNWGSRFQALKYVMQISIHS